MSSPNIVFFCADSFAQSVLDHATDNHVRFPNIERLQSLGTSFDTCIVQNPVCTPSRCSLFTGKYVHNTAHRSLSHLIQPHEPHLFAYLQEGGYDTDIIGKNDLLSESIVPWYAPSYRNNQYKPSHFPQPKYDVNEPRYYSFQYTPTNGGVYEKDQYFIDQAKAFLDNPKDNPFFLFVAINLPHPGYFSSLRYKDALSFDDITHMKPIVKDKPMFHQGIRDTRNLELLDEAELREIKATYFKMCLQVDDYLGQLLDHIDTDDTLFIFASDHGDYQGNYGLVEKWPSSAEDDIIKVPLIIAGPNIPSNQTIDTPVELLDIMATVLDVAEIVTAESHFSRSLLPLIQNRDILHKEYVFTEGGYDLNEPHIFEGQQLGSKEGMYYPKAYLQQHQPHSVCRFVSMRNKSYKLVVRTHDINEFYDLTKDPDECNNRYQDEYYKEIISKMEHDLMTWYLTTSDVSPQIINKRGFPTE